jgi:hypothetical protein
MFEEDTFDRIMGHLERLKFMIENGILTFNEDSNLPALIEVETLEAMKKRAEEQGISLSEWCKEKLSEESQLDRIERMLKDVKEKSS